MSFFFSLRLSASVLFVFHLDFRNCYSLSWLWRPTSLKLLILILKRGRWRLEMLAFQRRLFWRTGRRRTRTVKVTVIHWFKRVPRRGFRVVVRFMVIVFLVMWSGQSWGRVVTRPRVISGPRGGRRRRRVIMVPRLPIMLLRMIILAVRRVVKRTRIGFQRCLRFR